MRQAPPIPPVAHVGRPLGAAGFTLVELLVTVSIAAILMTVAVPSLQSLLAGRATQSGSEEFAGALRTARTEAIKRGQTVTICASSDPNAATPACVASGTPPWRSGWIVFVDRDGNGAIGTNDVVIKVGVPSQRIKALTENANLRYVSFLPNGLATGLASTNTAQFLFTPNMSSSASDYASKKRTLCLMVSGRASVQTGEVTC